MKSDPDEAPRAERVPSLSVSQAGVAQARERWPVLAAVERALAVAPRVVFAAAPRSSKRPPAGAASLWET